MNHYSVLLVDDEEDVLQIMMKKLNWEGMGFRVAGYARNGEEALETAEELHPDVVMTDIKMPYMDGLTLCKKLKAAYQNIKLIILTGFDEFEYAKEAIKAEVAEYILKPINASELGGVFERIKSTLDKELDEKRNIDKLRQYYLDSLPVLQENFYTSLLEGRIPESKICSYLQNYQINFTGTYYVVTDLHISLDNDQDNRPENGMTDLCLLGISVKKLVEEQLNPAWNFKILFYLGDIVVITAFDHKETVTRYTDTMDKLCKMAKRMCNASVTAGIGQTCEKLSELSMSYEGAKNAVSYRIVYGNTKAINIMETDPNSNNDIPWEKPYIKQIIKQIKMGENAALRAAIDEFIHNIPASKISLQRYRILLMELITEIYKFGNENQIEMEKIFGEDQDICGYALQIETPKALRQWLDECCTKLHDLVRTKRQDSTMSFVSKAIEYVEEHYADNDLTIDMICSYLNVSAAYFSTVFKKETGKTFINYLTGYRMELAVELLETGDDKTHVIAEQVGYSDPNYFSYVFKKQYGISPSKYRTNRLGSL
jgi:Response regulator containing CheY-like receiver domain and AraC-type DNA-binding domain